IGHRHAAGVVGIVVVADEVGAALDLGGAGTEKRGVGRGGVGGEGRLVGGRRAGTAEVGMGIVDAGVDDGDLDPLAVDAGDAGPGERRLDPLDPDGVVVRVDVHRLHVDD